MNQRRRFYFIYIHRSSLSGILSYVIQTTVPRTSPNTLIAAMRTLTFTNYQQFRNSLRITKTLSMRLLIILVRALACHRLYIPFAVPAGGVTNMLEPPFRSLVTVFSYAASISFLSGVDYTIDGAFSRTYKHTILAYT